MLDALALKIGARPPHGEVCSISLAAGKAGWFYSGGICWKAREILIPFREWYVFEIP